MATYFATSAINIDLLRMRYVCPLNQNKIDKAQGGKERARFQLKLENMNMKLWWLEKKNI